MNKFWKTCWKWLKIVATTAVAVLAAIFVIKEQKTILAKLGLTSEFAKRKGTPFTVVAGNSSRINVLGRWGKWLPVQLPQGTSSEQVVAAWYSEKDQQVEVLVKHEQINRKNVSPHTTTTNGIDYNR